MGKDIYSAKCKLEKGLKALDFLDTNINMMSNWLTEMEQKLNEIDNIKLSEKNIDQIKFIKVRLIPYNFYLSCFSLIPSLILTLIFLGIFIDILYLNNLYCFSYLNLFLFCIYLPLVYIYTKLLFSFYLIFSVPSTQILDIFICDQKNDILNHCMYL